MSLQLRTVIRGTAFASATPTLAHPCELDLVISLDRPRGLSREIVARVEGRAEVPPIAHDAHVVGELRLNWLVRPSALLDLDVAGGDGVRLSAHRLSAHRLSAHRLSAHRLSAHRLSAHRLSAHRLSAQWRPDALHPLASWTRMWARIDNESGAAIAWLQLHFDVRRDLATLVASLDRAHAAQAS